MIFAYESTIVVSGVFEPTELKLFDLKQTTTTTLSKLITFLISNNKEFNHFFKSRSSNIILQKVGNLHQNAKRYEARNTERKVHIYWNAKRDDQ